MHIFRANSLAALAIAAIAAFATVVIPVEAEAQRTCRAHGYSCPAGYLCAFVNPPNARAQAGDQVELYRCVSRTGRRFCPRGYRRAGRVARDGSFRCRPVRANCVRIRGLPRLNRRFASNRIYFSCAKGI